MMWALLHMHRLPIEFLLCTKKGEVESKLVFVKESAREKRRNVDGQSSEINR